MESTEQAVAEKPAARQELLPDDPLLSEEDAGRYIGGKSKRWMQQQRQTGGGPAYLRIGGNVRYRKSALDRYLASCERTSTSAA